MPLQDLLQTAAFAHITDRGWLRVTGEDRTRWLNGMTTNNIAALQPGQGCYTFFLNAQGKIQADAYAFAQSDSILLETQIPQVLADLLDRFIIMDDVELEVVGSQSGIKSSEEESWVPQATQPHRVAWGTHAGLLLAGPTAASLLTTLELPAAERTTPADLTLVSTTWQTTPVDILHTYSPLVPTFELWSDPATIGLLTETLRHLGAAQATPEDLTQLRILSGIPLYGTDIRDRDLPQETGQTRALHFSKGCYLGQEIVERIHSRGNVHRTFTAFTLNPEPGTDAPTAGTLLTALSAPDKPVGELTSVAEVNGSLHALGYIRREALTLNTPLTYPGGTAVPTNPVKPSTPAVNA